ncbi:MAG TPA: hypothetical protein VMF03_06580 [Steroidobacteraceae bacterium]|nr:hypothetical protein [Steroidobacteraceae bacterium]
MKTIAALCLILLSAPAFAASGSQSPPGPSACDRECLRGVVTQVLYALVDHDTRTLPVTDTLRVTEDGVEKPLAKVGLVRTVTKLRGYRQDIIDERAGQSIAGVVVEEDGAPVLLVVRARVQDQKISELELVAARSRAEGLSFTIDTFNAPSQEMSFAPHLSQLAPRDQAIAIALHYPKGLNSTQTFASVGTPFAPNTRRVENGAVMAGPDCVFSPTCKDIATQSLEIFKRLGHVTVRSIYVDERMGIVVLRLSWNVRGPGSDKLTTFELFKVYDGQIHKVEAFIRLLPPELDLGGWPITVSQP